jgi:hypothetical protein
VMEREEAAQLVQFLRSAPSWGTQINDEWKFAPSLAQIYERVKQEKIKAKHVEASGHTFELPSREPIPQWAQRWMCARLLYAKFGREKDERAFPEQLPHYTSEEIMPDDEWAKEAGSVNPETFARLWGHMTGSASPDTSTPTIEALLSGP